MVSESAISLATCLWMGAGWSWVLYIYWLLTAVNVSVVHVSHRLLAVDVPCYMLMTITRKSGTAGFEVNPGSPASVNIGSQKRVAGALG